MNNRTARTMAFLLCLSILCSLLCAPASAAQTANMPDVSEAMTSASYWSSKSKDAEELLASLDEINALNGSILTADGTAMHDLKSLPDMVNGIRLAESLRAGAEADAKYYIGWTYRSDGQAADQAFYDQMIANTVDPNARESQPVRYAVAVNDTTLLTFPSEDAILDDPTDPDFDYMNLTAVRVNEPLVLRALSADGRYYAAVSDSCSGWVRADDVAICADRDTWLSAWDLPAERILVVYGDKVYTAASNSHPAASRRMLSMGTVLELADWSDPDELVTNRAAYYNHVVYLPVRKEDGSYEKQPALLSIHQKVNAGYLPLTPENISMTAMNTLGNAYGWGGMLESNDCSGLIQDVYRCFGLKLARNTTWQSAMPVAKADLRNLCTEDKLQILDALPLGSALYFNGHTMLYLGQEDGKYYVLSSVSSMMKPRTGEARQRIRSVVLNTLDVRRANGRTWLQELNTALIPWADEGKTIEREPWYRNEVAYCLQHDLIDAPDGYFRPKESATRAEIVETLWRLSGSPETGGAVISFDDVSEDSPYVQAILWATENGLVNGKAPTAFYPDADITREELAAIFYRYAEGQGQTMEAEQAADLTKYTDAGQIAAWAMDALRWAAGAGLINGAGSTTLSPKGSITRAQLAAIVMRYASLPKNETEGLSL